MLSGTISTTIFGKAYRIAVHKVIIDTVHLTVCSVIGIKLASMHFRANSIVDWFPKIISDRKGGLKTHCIRAVLGLSEHNDKLRIANSSPNEFTMRFLHIILVHHSVLERGINALVTEKLLYLLNWHAFVDSHCSKRPSELVRMYLMKT